MEITVAKTAGFCFGVKRAVEKVYDQIATGKKPIYTYGPIIHNEEVVRDLEEKGVQVINSKEELEALKEGVVVIRSHGVGREIYELLERQGLELVDATCPFVKKIHKIVREQCEAGRRVIIVGNEHHPEVEGSKAGEMSILWQSSHWRNLKIWHSDRMKSSVSWRRRHLTTINFKI